MLKDKCSQCNKETPQLNKLLGDKDYKCNKCFYKKKKNAKNK